MQNVIILARSALAKRSKYYSQVFIKEYICIYIHILYIYILFIYIYIYIYIYIQIS